MDGAPTLADAFEARFLRHSPDLHESTSVLQFLHDQQPSVLLLAQRRREEDNADLLAAEQRVGAAFGRVTAGLRALSVTFGETLTIPEIRRLLFDQVLEDGRRASASLDHMRSCAYVRIHQHYRWKQLYTWEYVAGVERKAGDRKAIDTQMLRTRWRGGVPERVLMQEEVRVRVGRNLGPQK